MLTVPSGAILLMTRFATVCPATKLSEDEPLGAASDTDTKPAVRGAVTVTFSATAVAPAGTGEPLIPATATLRVLPAGTAARTGLVAVPTRVSSSRTGERAIHPAPQSVGVL